MRETRQAVCVFVEGGVPRQVRVASLGWERGDGYLEIYNKKSLVYAGRAVGAGDFRLSARLTVWSHDDGPTFVAGTGDVDLDGFERLSYGYWPREVLRHQHFFLEPGWFTCGKPFTFEVIRTGARLEIRIDGAVIHSCGYAGERFGKVGLCSWFPKMKEKANALTPNDIPLPDIAERYAALERESLWIHELRLEGRSEPLHWDRTMPTGITVPTLDLSAESGRQVVVAREPGRYFGHPDTELMADGRTMFCTFPLGHGGPACLLKKSTDGGLTWSDPLPVPENWNTATNCPCIHRVTGPDGVERLLVVEGNGAMRQSLSVDGGESWSPFEANGLRCIVVPNRLLPLDGGRLLAVYVDRGAPPSGHVIVQSASADGGRTWEPQRTILHHPDALPDEPGVIASPDGRQIAALMREQSRAYNSLLITSDDQGRTWSPAREVAAAVTGDRHNLRYAADGRLVAVFRDTAFDSPTKYQFVAWVGTYDDLVAGREGQYRVLLLRHHNTFPPFRNGDCGYAGLERLPDGTFVATTYVCLRPGEANSVVSVRFTLEELDARAGLS